MKFSHRVIVLSSIGFGFGVIFSVLLCAFLATVVNSDGTELKLCASEFTDAVGNPLLAFTIQAFASGINGVICMGGAAVYSIENWSLIRCTVIHFILSMTSYFTLAFSMRWFTFKDIKAALIMFVIMTIVYFIIWFINYLSYKAELKAINKELEEFKKADREVAK